MPWRRTAGTRGWQRRRWLSEARPRRRQQDGKAPTAVIKEACVQDISTPSVEDLVRAMEMEGVSRSHVSRLCAEIDERVRDVLARRIEGDWPCL